MTDPDRGALPAFIDRAWMEGVLAEAGVGSGADLASIEFAGWIGTGQMGRNGRILLHWDRDGESLPASVVVKLPSEDPVVAAASFDQGGYGNEVHFYDAVAPTVDCRVPHCYGTEYRPADREFALVMEDITGAVQGDQFTGLSPAQLDEAITQAVALHAPRHDEPGLAAALVPAGAPTPPPEEFPAMVEAVYAASIEPMIERLGHALDPEVVEVFRATAAHMGRLVRGADAPTTIVHGDFRADNFLFGAGAGSSPLVVVDWQTVRAGPAGADLAYVISGSFVGPDERARCEPELVGKYVDRMAEAGVVLDRDLQWEEYRAGSAWGLLITALATISATRTERGDALFTVMAQRHGWQAIHLDAASAWT